MIAIPISTATACGLSIVNKVIYEVIMNKYNKYKKQNERDQQTIKSFDKLYRKSLQVIIINKIEYESLCNILLNMFMQIKMNLFCQYERENEIKFF